MSLIPLQALLGAEVEHLTTPPQTMRQFGGYKHATFGITGHLAPISGCRRGCGPCAWTLAGTPGPEKATQGGIDHSHNRYYEDRVEQVFNKCTHRRMMRGLLRTSHRDQSPVHSGKAAGGEGIKQVLSGTA